MKTFTRFQTVPRYFVRWISSILSIKGCRISISRGPDCAPSSSSQQLHCMSCGIRFHDSHAETSRNRRHFCNTFESFIQVSRDFFTSYGGLQWISDFLFLLLQIFFETFQLFSRKLSVNNWNLFPSQQNLQPHSDNLLSAMTLPRSVRSASKISMSLLTKAL